MNGGSNLNPIIQQVRSKNSLKDWGEKNIVEASRKVAKALIKVSESELNTQVRKVLDAVRKIELDIKTRNKFSTGTIVLLKPKLAYAVSRKTALMPLMDVMDPMIDKVRDVEDFRLLVAFVESVIAYHRYCKANKNC